MELGDYPAQRDVLFFLIAPAFPACPNQYQTTSIPRFHLDIAVHHIGRLQISNATVRPGKRQSPLRPTLRQLSRGSASLPRAYA
ncbi:hypothetical protein OAE79_00025 [Rhodopirellula sp.]|nr:hypothetical protein [Rhodopirellula sp.]MDB4678700.1 hypothetical protein [Rhodopirellula sp.]